MLLPGLMAKKKKTYKKKVDFLTKNHGLPPFKNVHFLKFFRTLL